jgi:hypothetical protein
MRTSPFRNALLILPFSILTAHSAPIQNLTFTEVVKDVFIIDPGTKKETPAKSGDKLVPPNVLKTGADSRAELVAEDKTVTRVGSNTIFSVEANSRDVNLAQGSVLFHSPAGRGGGRIKSAGATASVLGTTLAVSANSDGGFKTSLLEGKGEVRDPKGAKVGLVAGQVTFAKPGGGLSPALNFDLKAQISNSKLVGGFSAPLASIAKIEAAVAVQQAKISGGALVSTGLLIGDRPDTAFKVDATVVDGQIRQAQTRREEQLRVEKEGNRFIPVDPRYLTSVLNDLRLTNQTAPDSNQFLVDGSGKVEIDDPKLPGWRGGVPKDLPRDLKLDQEGSGIQKSNSTYYALVSRNFTLELDPNNITNPPDFFLTQPLDQGDKEFGAAIVALESLSLKGAIEITGLDNIKKIEVETGFAESGQTLLLSAGKTLDIEPSSIIVANTHLFEIYTGGSSYAFSQNPVELSLPLSPLGPGEKPAPLILDRVSLINKFPLEGDSSLTGQIRINAPEIKLTDTRIFASEIGIESAGPVSIQNSSTIPESGRFSAAASGILLNLGFKKTGDVFEPFIEGFKIDIRSTGKTVSLDRVRFNSNEITLRGGDELQLNSVVVANRFDPDSTSRQTLDASAANNVFIDSRTTVGGQDTAANLLPAARSVNIHSDLGSVTILNTEFGSKYSPTDRDVETDFVIKALSKEILLTDSAINSDQVLFEGKTVTVKGVTIEPSDSANGEINMKATSSNLSVEKTARGNSFTAYQIVMTAKDEMKIVGLNVDHLDRSKENAFNAAAVNRLELVNAGLSYTQNVALEAQTVVLFDVAFKDGSNVALKSGSGVLSTPTDRAQITKGWVNVLPEVYYGPHNLHSGIKYQIDNNTALTTVSGVSEATTPQNTKGLDNGQLAIALRNQFPNNTPKITLQAIPK